MFTALVLEVNAEEVDPLCDALLDAGALSVSCEDARAGTAAEAPHFDGSVESVSCPRIKLTALCKVQPEPECFLLPTSTLPALPIPLHRLRFLPPEICAPKPTI